MSLLSKFLTWNNRKSSFPSIVTILLFIWAKLIKSRPIRFKDIDENFASVAFSSKKLTDLGFEFKFNLEDMFVGAVETCREKGLIPRSHEKQAVEDKIQAVEDKKQAVEECKENEAAPASWLFCGPVIPLLDECRLHKLYRYK